MLADHVITAVLQQDSVLWAGMLEGRSYSRGPLLKSFTLIAFFAIFNIYTNSE
jgi:hypothetical protein